MRYADYDQMPRGSLTTKRKCGGEGETIMDFMGRSVGWFSGWVLLINLDHGILSEFSFAIQMLVKNSSLINSIINPIKPVV